MTDTQVSQAAVLVAGSDTSAARLSQAAVLVAGSDTSALRLSQVVLLVLGSSVTHDIYADVLVVTPELPTGGVVRHDTWVGGSGIDTHRKRKPTEDEWLGRVARPEDGRQQPWGGYRL
jgi:hypothetical protein